MSDIYSAARFQAFVEMRLAGQNDLIYRNYDLLTKERAPGTIKTHLLAAGQYVPSTGVYEPIGRLQRKITDWGYGVLTHGQIEILLHEFWVYQRIKHYGKKNWPYRDPEDIKRLYDENAKAQNIS
jgi:hypothetical protein